MKRLRPIHAAALVILVGSLLFTASASAIDFKAAPNSPFTGLGPDGKGAVTGDFGGDSKDDIVSVSGSEGPSLGGGIYMLINQGGSFTETADSACSAPDLSPCLNDWPIAGIYKADFDQDGNPDVLTVREGLDRFTVWRGDGDGHLSYGGSMDPDRPLPSVNSLAIGDMNQDDYPDIVAGLNGGDFGIHVNMGINGPGMFSSAAPVVQSVAGAGANDNDYFGSVAIGDYNGGGVDIAFGQVACTDVGAGCASPFPASNAVFIADGDDSPINFVGATGNPHPVPSGQVITDVATIQVDVEFTPPGLAVATSAGTGGEIHTFVGHTSLALAPNPSAESTIETDGVPSALAAGRLNTDLLSDLAWIENGTSAGVAVQTGEGAFRTEPSGPFAVSSSDGDYRSLSIGSFTSNGAAGMAFGGTNPDSQTGTVGVLLPADEFKVDPSLDFGSVETGSTKTLSLEIRNSGVFANWLVDQEITDDASGAFSISDHGNCREVGMDAGTTCTIMVTFAPTAIGSHNATLRVDRDGPSVETILSGTGADPTPDPDPDPDPDLEPVTRVKLKLKSLGKVKRGGKVKVRAIVRNTGNQTINRLVLKARVPRKLARTRKQAIVKRITPGKTIRRTFVIKVKPKAKRGKKVVLKIRARTAGKTLKSARKVVRIR